MSIFTKIEHGRTADEVAQQLESLLLEGVLSPKDKLPAERDLAAQLNVSRPILREALKALENNGLLISKQGGGTFVGDIVGQTFKPAMMDLIIRHKKATRDYLEYRREIESISAEFAACRATQADQIHLKQIILAMKQAYADNDLKRESELDIDFHNAIGECTHNVVMLHTLRSCYRLLSEGILQSHLMLYSIPQSRDKVLEQHIAIYEAIIERDPQTARDASRAHIDYVEHALNEVERSGRWEHISKLRLEQRTLSTDKSRQT